MNLQNCRISQLLLLQSRSASNCNPTLFITASAAGYQCKPFDNSQPFSRRRCHTGKGRSRTDTNTVVFRTQSITPTERAAGIALDSDKVQTDGSTSSTSAADLRANRAAKAQVGVRKVNSGTGVFQRLPQVSPASEHIGSACKRAERVAYNTKIKNEGARVKNRMARQLDTLTKEVAGPLGKYVRDFPQPHRLHPFEHALLQLTIGEDTYTKALAKVDQLRKAALEVGKSYAARAARSSGKKDALMIQQEGFDEVSRLYNKGAAAVDELKEVAKKLRRVPVVDTQVPTVVLVGAPNVGKSSLVQMLSSGTPEVCNYPFTTRSIKMGHFFVTGRRHQVMDTPGLLRRPMIERNDMEKLTIACMEHLPTAVLFVMDLTEDCGTSAEDQWHIRKELLSLFPNKPWIDVMSKADVLQDVLQEAQAMTPDQLVADVRNPLECAAHLIPGAVWVSALTGEGCTTLQQQMMEMVERQNNTVQRTEHDSSHDNSATQQQMHEENKENNETAGH